MAIHGDMTCVFTSRVNVNFVGTFGACAKVLRSTNICRPLQFEHLLRLLVRTRHLLAMPEIYAKLRFSG